MKVTKSLDILLDETITTLNDKIADEEQMQLEFNATIAETQVKLDVSVSELNRAKAALADVTITKDKGVKP